MGAGCRAPPGSASLSAGFWSQGNRGCLRFQGWVARGELPLRSDGVRGASRVRGLGFNWHCEGRLLSPQPWCSLQGTQGDAWLDFCGPECACLGGQPLTWAVVVLLWVGIKPCALGHGSLWLLGDRRGRLGCPRQAPAPPYAPPYTLGKSVCLTGLQFQRMNFGFRVPFGCEVTATAPSITP